jgi:hypothetical protein
MDTPGSGTEYDDLRSVSARSEQEARSSAGTSLVSSVTALWPWKS